MGMNNLELLLNIQFNVYFNTWPVCLSVCLSVCLPACILFTDAVLHVLIRRYLLWKHQKKEWNLLIITKETPPNRRQWHRSSTIINSFEQISHCFSVSVVDFEDVNTGWVVMSSYFSNGQHEINHHNKTIPK